MARPDSVEAATEPRCCRDNYDPKYAAEDNEPGDLGEELAKSDEGHKAEKIVVKAMTPMTASTILSPELLVMLGRSRPKLVLRLRVS